MDSNFQHLMSEATRLTQSGDLAGATAFIQRALGGGGGAGDGAAGKTAPDGAPADAPLRAPFAKPAFGPGFDVIDVVARKIDESLNKHMGHGAGDDTTADAAEPVGPAVPLSESEIAAQRDRFIAGDFGTARSGRRAFKLYVPPQAGTGEPLPLVLMLHGCTQEPDDFARGTAMNELARKQGFFVLYPAQSSQANPQRCWNWFKHNHQQRGRGEPALLAAMVDDVATRYKVDRSRVYAAGLSAGGAMAAILGAAYPEVFAAVGVHSGLAAGAANDLPSALAAMQSGGNGPRSAGASGMPTIVFHGDADGTVHPSNAEQVLAASLGPAATRLAEEAAGSGKRRSTRRVHRDANGVSDAEIWIVHGAPHAWAGGQPGGSYTDASGPDASAEMLRFFEQHRLGGRAHQPGSA